MNDDYSHHQNSAACYQLAQSILKVGSVLAERVGQGEMGQGEVGGCTALGGFTALGDSGWQLLQLAIEKAWSALDAWPVLLSCTNERRNGPFTL